MKFAKELDHDLVPEWRVKYFNYKAGKKRVKAVEKALRAAAPSPHTGPGLSRQYTNSSTPRLRSARTSPRWLSRGQGEEENVSLATSPAPVGRGGNEADQKTTEKNGNGEDSSKEKVNHEESTSKEKANDENTNENKIEDKSKSDPHRTPLKTPLKSSLKSPGKDFAKSPKSVRIPETPKFALAPPPPSPPPGLDDVLSPPSGGTITRSGDGRDSFSLPAPALNFASDDDNDDAIGDDEAPIEEPRVRDFLYEPASHQSGSKQSSPLHSGPKEPTDRGPTPLQPSPLPAGSLTRSPFMDGKQPPALRRIFTAGTRGSVSLDRLEVLRNRQQEFFAFMDGELVKIEEFYRQKEDHAGERLFLLQSQLHEMRDRRAREVADIKMRKKSGGAVVAAATATAAATALGRGIPGGGQHHSQHKAWTAPIMDKLRFSPGPNSKALQQMASTPVAAKSASQESTPGPSGGSSESWASRQKANLSNRDYSRRRVPGEHNPDDDDQVPYRIAKRKLKLALQEFHRSLEMLKSYALLNRTAFRKLNKKYDKAVGTPPDSVQAGEYVARHVNGAYFVTSDVVDGHIRVVEDLYARYFERGNRKVAVGKLRKGDMSRQTAAASNGAADRMFVNGIMIGTGLVFAIQGLVLAIQLMHRFKSNEDDDDDDDDDDQENPLGEQTAYLLQLYAGYFLGVLLLGLFCLVCKTWAANKVNYHFIFEFNPRDQLDWRELSTFPSFFMMLLGLVMWLNFGRYGANELFLWYPVILVGLTVVLLLVPVPMLFHRSRRWLAISHWRLFMAGLYPVEFRDFFLGDMYCSLAYAVANIELFFCLYARNFDELDECNSSHSRLMGFLSVLPPIWRFLQCIRRYYDTRNAFPHLANCGKYAATILTGVALSFYRIERSTPALACYLTIAILNSIFTTLWDLFMDFSLLQSDARHPYLRDILAIKQRWLYYLVLVIDPILRFGWIPYVAAAHELQHSSLVSFCVALAEVLRRALWALLRVENEHCSNVAQYKASRDVPLPYRLELFVDDEHDRAEATPTQPSPAPSTRPFPRISPQPSHPPSPAVVSTPIMRARAKSTAAQSIIGVPLDEHDNGDIEAQRPSGDAEDSASGSIPPTSTGAAAPGTPSAAGMRRRHRPSFSHKRNISRIIAEAHKQDFEKRRPVESDGAANDDDGEGGDMVLSDEEDGGNNGGGVLTRQLTNASMLSARLRGEILGRVQEERDEGR